MCYNRTRLFWTLKSIIKGVSTVAKNALESHHCLWTRVEWSSKASLRALRRNCCMKVTINAELHDQLHLEVEPIRIPASIYRAENIVKRVVFTGNLETDLMVLVAEFRYEGEYKTAKDINSQIKWLVAHRVV